MAFPNMLFISGQDVLAQSSTQKHPLGTIGQTRDGRQFRYMLAGSSSIAACKLIQVITQGDLANDTVAKLSTDITTYAVTAKYIKISTTWGSPGGATGVTKDMFKDGYLWVSATDAGVQTILTIKSNTTGTSDTGGYSEIYWPETEALPVAIDTSIKVSVLKNPYSGVAAYAGLATETGIIAGVAVRPVTAAYYFWGQIKGPCPVLCDGTVTIGSMVSVCTSTGIGGVAIYTKAMVTGTDITALSAIVAQAANRQVIGRVLFPCADTKYSLVDLQL